VIKDQGSIQEKGECPPIFGKKCETAPVEKLRGWEETEKNMKSKLSWHCPFNESRSRGLEKGYGEKL
jgi:hypothetical protein